MSVPAPSLPAGGIYRRAERRFAPWKNGGGETAEILVSPVGAGFDDFDWRISTARVAHSGPFSVFEGVDRVLAVLEGGAMTLSIGQARHRLDADAAPLAFPGDVACTAALEGAPLLDLNVMVRRPLQASVRRGAIARPAREAAACYALLAEPHEGLGAALGLERHDLIDLLRAEADLVERLSGAAGIVIEIAGR